MLRDQMYRVTQYPHKDVKTRGKFQCTDDRPRQEGWWQGLDLQLNVLAVSNLP
jgi:hypothetical protein